MLSSARLADFVAAPVGRYFASDHFLIWAATPTLCGTTAWGTITPDVAQQLVAAWAFEAQLTAPYTAIIDLAALGAIEPASFETIATFMQAAAPRLAQRVERQALIRPPGLSGAVVAGFYPTLQPGFEWRDFDAADAAYRWCVPDAPTLHAELDERVHAVRASTSLLPRVHAELARRLTAPPSLAAMAEHLAVAPRTLQRALQHASTTYRDEVTRLRVEAAARLLRDSDDKIATIARRVGFASMPGFSAAFAKRLGCSPSSYRRTRPAT